MNLQLENAHANETIRRNDIIYRRWHKNNRRNSNIQACGIRCSELHKRAERAEFRAFEKANKEIRGRMYEAGKVDHTDTLILRYARDLLGRTNRSIMEINNVAYLKKKPLNTLVKYPGGKTGDLKHLRESFIELFPKTIGDYYEPFLGGGAVWLAVEPQGKMYVNDFSDDLIEFYTLIKNQDQDFFGYIAKMGKAWQQLHDIAVKHVGDIYKGDLSPLTQYKTCIDSLVLNGADAFDIIKKIVEAKLPRIKKVEEKKKSKLSDEDQLANIEGALKAGYYTYVRDVYNHHKKHDALRAAAFYFLRDYAFSSMFRFSKDGRFNVPYGGVSYNDRSPDVRSPYWQSEALLDHLNKTEFDNLDFEEFLNKRKPKKDDFLFIDPPYDSEFSTYDQNEFSQKDQKRLADYLINKSKAQFMAVMKNTDFIYGLYAGHEDQNVRWKTFDKNYTVSFRNRNDKEVEHIVVYRIND